MNTMRAIQHRLKHLHFHFHLPTHVPLSLASRHLPHPQRTRAAYSMQSQSQPQPHNNAEPRPPNPIATALRKYTTCDVSDALCRLGHGSGGFVPGLTMWSPLRQAGATRMVGPAYTVRYAPVDDAQPKLAGHYIDTVPAGAVIVISAPPGSNNALYGGLMSLRARGLGAVGTVVDGRFRDVQEQRDLAWPVFARDVGTAPPGPVLKVVAVDEPVDLRAKKGPGDDEESVLQVKPGDYVIGDANGVVVLPASMAEKALEMMEKLVAADEKMAEGIKAGMSFVEASKKFRS